MPAWMKTGQREELHVIGDRRRVLDKEEAYPLSARPPSTPSYCSRRRSSGGSKDHFPSILLCDAVILTAAAPASAGAPFFPPVESPLPPLDPLPQNEQKCTQRPVEPAGRWLSSPNNPPFRNETELYYVLFPYHLRHQRQPLSKLIHCLHLLPLRLFCCLL